MGGYDLWEAFAQGGAVPNVEARRVGTDVVGVWKCQEI